MKSLFKHPCKNRMSDWRQFQYRRSLFQNPTTNEWWILNGWIFSLKVQLWPGCKEHCQVAQGRELNATTAESFVHFKFKGGCAVVKGCQERLGYCQTCPLPSKVHQSLKFRKLNPTPQAIGLGHAVPAGEPRDANIYLLAQVKRIKVSFSVVIDN